MGKKTEISGQPPSLPSIAMPNVSLGGLATFNMQHGFVESIVRGFRSGFLQDETYHHLTQCETLEVSSLQ